MGCVLGVKSKFYAEVFFVILALDMARVWRIPMQELVNFPELRSRDPDALDFEKLLPQAGKPVVRWDYSLPLCALIRES
jgi:hypothetical protein